MPAGKRPVAIIMGSKSDWATMRHAADTLKALRVGFDARVVSAHRTPDRLYKFAKGARAEGFKVVIAGAGGAAHLPGMVAAHAVLTTPFVIRMVSASLAEFDPAVEEAAKNLGATATRTFFLVTLPLIRPGVVAGAVFAFIISFDELVVSLFLAGPGMQTLPIRIFTSLEYSSRPSVSAVSTLLILVWLVVGVPLYRRFLDVRHT